MSKSYAIKKWEVNKTKRVSVRAGRMILSKFRVHAERS